MTVILLNDEGEEVEAYSQEEMDAKETEHKEALTVAETKATDAEDHLKQKTDQFVQAKAGFKKLADLSDEEKGKLTEEQIAMRTQLEETQAVQETERKDAKEAMFKVAAQGNEEMLTKLKENYDLINMPEGSTTEIQDRINRVIGMTYNDLGIVEKKPISIESTFASGGAVPRVTPEEEKKFSETEKGKDMEKQIFGSVLPAEEDKK